ncbi:hypothetical protein LBMAG27_19800 [Bacteroidota bacterium]|nr:hypothetical protein LBMAG27_19800 [Bacteroidota bacterium]
MISRHFLKSSLIYSIFGALPLASSIILLPFYTNLLSTTDFGLLAIFISFTLLMQIFVNLSFDALVGIHYFELKDNSEKLNAYISTVFISLIIIGAIFISISFILGPPIFKWVFSGKIDFFPYGFMSIATAVFNSFFKTYTFLLINQQRPIRFLWMNLFNFILTIAISIFGLYLYPQTLIGPMNGRLLSGVGIFLLTFLYVISETGIVYKPRLLKGAIAFCAPIVIYFSMSWLISYADRFIINYFDNPADVGVFDFSVKCTLLIDFALGGLISAIYPKVYSIWKEQKINYSSPEVNKYFHSLSALNLLMIALTILFIPLIIPMVVTNKNYYLSFQFLPILSISFITRALLNMYIAPVYFFKKTIILPKVFFITAVFQFTISFFMVKYFGLWGAVWAIALIKPIQLVMMWYESNKIFKFSFNSMKLIFLPLAYCILVIATNYFLSGYNYYIINSFGLFIVCVLIFLVYRNEIFDSFSFIKKKYL